MMTIFGDTAKESDEWYTPPEIIHSLGTFDLDPATSLEAYALNKSAKKIYTRYDDGLNMEWDGRVWLNPPYSQPLMMNFLKKMATHNNGIALVFAKIESKWFHDVVLYNAVAAKFLYGRIRFLHKDGTKGDQPRNGSMLLAYGWENVAILKSCSIKGKFVLL